MSKIRKINDNGLSRRKRLNTNSVWPSISKMKKNHAGRKMIRTDDLRVGNLVITLISVTLHHSLRKKKTLVVLIISQKHSASLLKFSWNLSRFCS